MSNQKKYQIWIIIFAGLLFSTIVNSYHFSKLIAILDQALDPETITRANQQLSMVLKSFTFHLIYFYAFAFINLYIHDAIRKAIKSEYLKISSLVLCNIILYVIITTAMYYNITMMELKRAPKLIFLFINNIWVVALGVSTAYLLILWQKNKFSEIESIKLKEEKKNAQLAALKDQISPHFLFNTLSSLSSVVRNEDKDSALEFIQEISNTFRYTLSNRNADRIRISEELNFIKSYIFLLKKRFDNKLLINIDISKKYKKANLPTMSVQMLIENAVNHNVITQAIPLVIDIFAENDFICVKNNFNPRQNHESTGMGLTNLANRYKLLANKDIIIKKDDNYFQVKIPIL